MERIAKVNDTEYKILELIREGQKQTVGSVGPSSMQRELEDIYQILTNLEPYSQNEQINEAIRRLYGLLY